METVSWGHFPGVLPVAHVAQVGDLCPDTLCAEPLAPPTKVAVEIALVEAFRILGWGPKALVDPARLRSLCEEMSARWPDRHLMEWRYQGMGVQWRAASIDSASPPCGMSRRKMNRMPADEKALRMADERPLRLLGRRRPRQQPGPFQPLFHPVQR